VSWVGLMGRCGGWWRAVAGSAAIGNALRKIGSWDQVASLVVMFSFAFAQPLLGLLGENPEFFLAQSALRLEVVILGLLIGVALPFALGAAVWGLSRLFPRAGRAGFLALVATLGVILWVQVTEAFGVSSIFPLIAGSVVLSAGTLAIYLHSGGVRSAIRLLGVLAPLVIVANYVVLSPAAALVFPGKAAGEQTPIAIGNPVPIVMIVLDELPLASLIDSYGFIQTDLYPNVSQLADDSMWFRNASTVESNTERAIPSIVTGQHADRNRVPIASDYPETLFTLLSNVYDIRAIEPLTDLCPDSVCGEDAQDFPTTFRWHRMFSDLRIITLHVMLPEVWTSGLPPIDQNWADFGAEIDPSSYSDRAEFSLRERFDEKLTAQRAGLFGQFLRNLSVPPGSRPPFNFLHLLLPHQPWSYLPDGRKHGAPLPVAAGDGHGWVSDEWLVNQIYQQHLLQVQYTDRLIGLAIDRMRELGSYDESLIVVMADHGITFRPGVERRRGITDDSLGDIAAVPLLMKFPGGEPRGVDDYRAELTDIVPTIADLIEAQLTWETTGHSLLSDQRPPRAQSSINSGAITFGVSGQEKLEIAARKLEIFEGGDPFKLAVAGYQDLLGTQISELDIDQSLTDRATVLGLDRYEVVDLEGASIPAHLTGTLSADAEEPTVLGIALNGSIVAVTQTFMRDGDARFQAMLPPNMLRISNDIEIFRVERVGEDRRFNAVSLEN